MSRRDLPSDPRSDHEAAVDRLLRDALDPDVRTVGRVLARVRAPRQRQRSVRRPLLALACSLIVLTALSVAFWPRGTAPPRSPEAHAARISITNVDGALTVTIPSSGRWIVLDNPGETP